MKTTRDYLTDVLLYISRIEDVAKHGKADFVANYLFHDAVIREYEVIGEIIKRLPAELLPAQSGVNWKTIKGFRDFLAHNYVVYPQFSRVTVSHVTKLTGTAKAMPECSRWRL